MHLYSAVNSINFMLENIKIENSQKHQIDMASDDVNIL